MPIPVTCPACRSTFRVLDEFAGKRGLCPTCGKVVEVPDPERDEPRRPPREEDRRSRTPSPDRDDDDRPPRRERERDRDRERDRNDRRHYRNEDDREESRRSRRVGYYWKVAATGATPLTVGYILLAVACLIFLICEFGAFGIGPEARVNRNLGFDNRIGNLGQSLRRGEVLGIGFTIQVDNLVNPTHLIVMLFGSATAVVGAGFVGFGHNRMKAVPLRRLAGFSGLAGIFCLIGSGLIGLGFLMGFLFAITNSTSGALPGLTFYVTALAAIGILVGELLYGIALTDLGSRYDRGGLKWFSLGVWIGVAVLILLQVIFVLTTISDNEWAKVFLKANFLGARPGVGFGLPVSQTNGVYVAFLILSLATCVVSIFPLNMAKDCLLSGEPPTAQPRRRKPEWDDYDDEWDRDRDRDWDRDEDDDYDRRRPPRR